MASIQRGYCDWRCHPKTQENMKSKIASKVLIQKIGTSKIVVIKHSTNGRRSDSTFNIEY